MSRAARRAALKAVDAVVADGETLDTSLDRFLAASPEMEARDRAFARHTAYGTVRHLRLLDHLLIACMNKPLDPKRREVWALLRTSLFQGRFMRVPPHAAVNEAVDLVKKSRRDGKLSGFVNAVLRRALKLDAAETLATLRDPVERMAVEFSHPTWMVRRWVEVLGEELTRERLEGGNQPGPLTLRVNTLQVTPERFLEALENPVASHKGEAVTLAEPVPVEGLPGYDDGWFAVQDKAAQLTAAFLDPQPGDRILDACAAPGGKTAHLAALADGKGEILALEWDKGRIPRLKENMARLKIPGVEVIRGDAGDEKSLGRRLFDRILVDAPCFGTGVIRRRPDIKWRRRAVDLGDLMRTQDRILDNAAAHTAPGGVLLYVTCSLEPEENQGRVTAFLRRHDTWSLEPLSGEGVKGAGFFETEPGEGGMDGFFAAKLVNRG